MPSPWITSREAARRFRTTHASLHHLGKCGTVRTHKASVRRMEYHVEDLEAFFGQRPFDGTYTDPAGMESVSTRLAIRRFGLTDNQLRDWTESDCPVIGRPLRTQLITVMETVSRDGGPTFLKRARRRVYSVPDLAAAAAGLANDDDWLTVEEAAELYGFGLKALYNWWRKRCNYLPGGRRLGSKRMRRATAWGGAVLYRRRRVYSRADLDTIWAACTPDPLPGPSADADRDWLTVSEAAEQFGRLGRLSRWTDGGDNVPPGLGGKRLRSRIGVATICGRRRRTRLYYRPDLVRIAAARAAAAAEPSVPMPGAASDTGARHAPAQEAKLPSVAYPIEPHSNGRPNAPDNPLFVHVVGGAVVSQPDGPPPVELSADGREARFLGLVKVLNTVPRQGVVSALVKAWPDRLSEDQLVKNSKSGDAVSVLRRLADGDPDWAAVIDFPGPGGQWRGYGLKNTPQQ